MLQPLKHCPADWSTPAKELAPAKPAHLLRLFLITVACSYHSGQTITVETIFQELFMMRNKGALCSAENSHLGELDRLRVGHLPRPYHFLSRGWLYARVNSWSYAPYFIQSM